MTLIDQFLAGKGSTIIKELTASGFSVDQAQKFAPAAGQQLLQALIGSDQRLLKSAADSSSVTALLAKIDVGKLASQFGIDKETAQSGLFAMVPAMIDFVRQNGGALAGGLVSGLKEKSGGIAGIAKGLFG